MHVEERQRNATNEAPTPAEAQPEAAGGESPDRARFDPVESIGNAHATVDGTAELARHAVDHHLDHMYTARPPTPAPLPAGEQPLVTLPLQHPHAPARPPSLATRAMANPELAGTLRVAGGVLGARDVYNGVNQTREAVRHNDAEGATQGALTTAAGGGAVLSAIVPAAATVAAVPAIASTAYTTTRQANDASGEALEYFGVGGLRSTPGRGVHAAPEVHTDNRRVSDRISDAWHDATLGVFDGMARDLSPHLPIALGGEEMPVQIDGPVHDGTRQPTSAEIDARVRAEEPARRQARDAENDRHAGDMSPGANALMSQMANMTPAEAQQARAAIQHGRRRPDGTVWIDTPSWHGPVNAADIPALSGAGGHIAQGGSPVVDPETQRQLRAQHDANTRRPGH